MRAENRKLRNVPVNGQIQRAPWIGTHTGPETRVQQNAKEDTDINVIVDRYMKTGQLPNQQRTPQFANIGSGFDYRHMLDTIIAAREQFLTLPAKVRNRFDNDPAKLIDFIRDDDNYDEAVKLGLIPKKETANEPQRQNDSGSNTGKKAKGNEKPGKDNQGDAGASSQPST